MPANTLPRLPAGSAPSYQDLLRAVGWHLDEVGWHHVVITEDHAGLIIEGTCAGNDGDEDVMLHLPACELPHLLAQARRRRRCGAAGQRQRQPRLDGSQQSTTHGVADRLEITSYQGRLRAVGWLSDTAGLQCLRVQEDGADLVLQGHRLDPRDIQVLPSRLTPGDIGRLLNRLAEQRRTDPAPAPTG
jgi:hypothetical protein